MEICKTDVEKIIKYLYDAGAMYDRQTGQKNVCRARVIRRLIAKLNKKLFTQLKNKNNEKD